MRHGFRNRLMRWGGVTVPFRPGKRGLVGCVLREPIRCSWRVRSSRSPARAGSTRGRGWCCPFSAALPTCPCAAGVPVVPVAINGTSWLGFRRVVRIRIGMPILRWPRANQRPAAEQVERLTAQTQSALEAMVADFPDQPRPGPLGRWLTELFNDWPEGSRPPAQADDTAWLRARIWPGP